MNQKKINIAQIGIGYWGPNLLRNLVANSGCKVSKVVDLSEARLDYVKGLYPGIITTSDLDEVFTDTEIDAIIISTPVNTHFELTITALEFGKHVLVEKPMATSVDQIEKIEQLAKEKNRVAMVGHTFLFNSAVRYVKKLIDSGEIGEMRYIYSQRLNLGRIRSDVDALWNLAPHDVSIIQYWLDEPEPVKIIRTGMDYVQKGIDDVVFMNIEYPDNIIAHIHVSWLDPHKIRRMTIVGSKKMIVYDDITENKVTIYNKGIDRMAELGKNMDCDVPSNLSFNHRSGDIYIPKIKWEEPLKVEIKHFLDCIINDTICITDTSHAKKVISILSSTGQSC